MGSGRDVAFLTDGDPSLYSTFIYLREEAPTRRPEVGIEVIPGVTSITAVPAVTGIPLADGQERIAFLPGTYAYGVQDLTEVLRRFDTVRPHEDRSRVAPLSGAPLPRTM
ncbi:MAG: SAM-dependent methyltransferase [Gammaproteobacteria bacterium]